MNISDKVKHVFVLMLENHSFDNVLAKSGIPGINAATDQDYNRYGTGIYHVSGNAPDSMPTDPGHEFLDVVEQLCGVEARKNYKGGPYPPIQNKGFASNYATSQSEDTGLPQPDQIGDIMKCFNTQTQLPITYQLATEFAVCDQWYSSLPGPTWPNRFFVHGGSSAGLDHSPTTGQIANWEANPFSNGFEYEHGSIYQRLTEKGVSWNLFHDASGTYGGQIPQVASIHKIHQWDVWPMFEFHRRLKNGQAAQYNFIEPNYGDVYRTYKHGSSQHPMDGMGKGEALIKEVYEALRNSSIWEESLLIITYDEHGGFYDHAAPPPAVIPGDKTMDKSFNEYGFDFAQYGVRVPAIVVSPFIAKGSVGHNPYDHTSVIATLNEIFGIGTLTRRDAAANSVGSLLSLDNARADCPTTLVEPAATAFLQPSPDTEEEHFMDLKPLPEGGNLIGFHLINLKAELEMVGDDAAGRKKVIEEFKNVKTRGEARLYGQRVNMKVLAQRAKILQKDSSKSIPGTSS